ncbi:MAG: hypothetical protein ACK4MG_04050 [Aquabacterium sp.]
MRDLGTGNAITRLQNFVSVKTANVEPTPSEIKLLLARFAAIPPAPCDGCWMRDYCAKQAKACDTFARYVRSGGRLQPPVEPDPCLDLQAVLAMEA